MLRYEHDGDYFLWLTEDDGLVGSLILIADEVTTREDADRIAREDAETRGLSIDRPMWRQCADRRAYLLAFRT